MPFPKTNDGRVIYLPSRFKNGLDPYFAGCDDDGNLFNLGWTSAPGSPDDKFMEWSFHDWVHVGKGTVRYKNAGLGDYIAFKIIAKATQVTSNGTNEGNCNLTDLGGYNLITPASGDGTHDVADEDKVPVPAPDKDGYWDWDSPDTGKGSVTPGTAQQAAYNLYDIDIDIVRWIRKLPLLGDGVEVLHPETVSRKLLPHWTARVDLHNESLNTLEVSWHLDCARKETT